MTSEGRRKYRNQVDNIREKQNCAKQEKEFILNDFVNYLDQVGTKKKSTKANYLVSVRKLLDNHTEIRIEQIREMSEKELRKLNTEVVRNIQDSEYRYTKGETSKRKKRHLWTCWKRILEAQGVTAEPYKKHIPSPVKFSSDESKVDKQANTQPEDLPYPDQMREFLKSIKRESQHNTELRNMALVGFIWDAGTRIGETLPIQMKDISVNGKQLKVKIQGNKGSEDRRIEIFQNRYLIKQWIEQHPYKDERDAYLFCNIRENKPCEQLSKQALRRMIHRSKDSRNLDFKTYGEPFHIFRKAMITFYVVNDILTWEEVCKRLGKQPDATKPDYLKIALSDVDSSIAEGFGLDEKKRDKDVKMKQPGLMPSRCVKCGKLNPNYSDVCHHCGCELPRGKMPKVQEQKGKSVKQNEIQNLRKELDRLENELKHEQKS